MLSLAQKERGIPVHETDLDKDPFTLNCLNGMIDLRSGELLSPDPDKLCVKSTRCNFNPDAEAPMWTKFLEDTFQKDFGLLNFVQRWIGYSLTADTSAQTFAIFYGIGANGKSTLVETMRKVAGDYVRIAPPDTFIQKQAGGIPNDIAALRGSRMVLTTETEANARLAESKVKQMTGGEEISARYMRGEYFEFTPTWKIIISTNHKPRISGGDYGIWRRVALVPFRNVVAPEDQDTRLMEKLYTEAEGILNWAVRGAAMWYEDGGGRVGLQVPKVIYDETQEYREDEDAIGRFLSEGCMKAHEIKRALEKEQIVRDWSTASQVLYSFRAWADKEGESHLAKITANAMGRALRERGFSPERSSSGKRYKGIVPYDMKDNEGGERGNYYN
jgi:putative DNA primase/helicase